MEKKYILILKGTILFTPTAGKFEIHPDSYLISQGGIICGIYKDLPEEYKDLTIEDYGNSLIIPGFVDLHTHAPQFNQIGLGLDYKLLDWLNHYTFQEENNFRQVEYAQKVYEKFADTLVSSGTTRSAIFATIHPQSCQILFEILKKKGLGAYLGKVNMDTKCPDFIKENTQQSLANTEELILAWSDSELVKPIITPRFAPTSTRKLLEGLGKLALKYNLPVQSHLAENPGEIEWVQALFPEHDAYYKVYDHYNLFGQTPTLMAHCIHLTDDEIDILATKKVVPVHCPDSNLNLTSGIMPTRKMLKAGVTIGLGSDIGAGHSLFMPQTIVRAIQLSKMYSLHHEEDAPLTLPEAFYMATKGGGSFFGKVGSFEPGYAADALVIKNENLLSKLSPLEEIQHFIYAGSAQNIAARYAAGKKL